MVLMMSFLRGGIVGKGREIYEILVVEFAMVVRRKLVKAEEVSVNGKENARRTQV